ncbi:hypothetical protein NW758_014100 [Fusarium oxysporum]|nr:hypothetical protein NW758_014100 [Fusarium oxysporum]
MPPHVPPIANAACPFNRAVSENDAIETLNWTPVRNYPYQPRRRATRRQSTPSDFAPSDGISVPRHNSQLRTRVTKTSFETMDENLSDRDQDSVTIKEDRQQVINRTHPFGIRIWNSPLYHEENPTHNGEDGSISGHDVGNWTFFFNLLWTLLFGWWLGLLVLFCGIICMALSRTQTQPTYGRVLYGLAGFVFYPFDKSVKYRNSSLHVPDSQREGSTSYHGQRFGASSENDQLLCYPSLSCGHDHRSQDGSLGAETTTQQPLEPIHLPKSSLFRKQWSFERTMFTLVLYFLLLPTFLLVAMVCWCLVLPLPTARMLVRLLRIVRSYALQISFARRSKSTLSTIEAQHTVLIYSPKFVDPSSWKQSFGGVNIVLINLMVIAILTAFDWLVVFQLFHSHSMILSLSMFFLGSLLGIIPLVYVIGQAVASISTQSSMGTSAVVNALFSTIFEVIFYCVALKHGKGELVESCIIGSILAGVLFLPGLSMCFGALKRKTQRFNAKSAGVTSTMLLFAIMGVFSPTIFYAIYGPYVMKCGSCTHSLPDPQAPGTSCRTCSVTQPLDLQSSLYDKILKPFSYLCAFLLLLAYVIGLLFTLRTHSTVIWNEGSGTHFGESSNQRLPIPSHQRHQRQAAGLPYVHPRPPRLRKNQRIPSSGVIRPTRCEAISEASELSQETEQVLAGTRLPRNRETAPICQDTTRHVPNWSRRKSLLILLMATLFYCILAVILIDAVDTILQKFCIEEKFLGLTVFALIPNITEIWNAILFAANGSIALSVEIGSAYTLQVCLLQIPALVFFSAVFRSPGSLQREEIFPLVFPQWDMFVVIFSVFLHGYMQNEGRSNYFKGSIPLLSYIVVMIGFFLSDERD